MDVFPARHAYPQSKMLSFFRREPFFLQARYTDARPNAEIGKFCREFIFLILILGCKVSFCLQLCFSSYFCLPAWYHERVEFCFQFVERGLTVACTYWRPAVI